MNRIPDPDPPRADATAGRVLAAALLMLGAIVALLAAGVLPMTP